MTLNVWCQTDVGLRRERNEDSVLFDQELGLYMVADGMGGHRGGEVASKMAVETLRDFVAQAITEGGRRLNPRLMLAQGYEKASQKIYKKSQEADSGLVGMGTTLVSAFVNNGTVFIANVGDSRAYLYSAGRLWQMTEDHSLVNEQVRAGLMSESDVGRFGSKNVITRSVGFEPEVQTDVVERQLQPGEIVLMCSDGLSGLVTDQRLEQILQNHTPAEIVPICIDEANRNGGDDNVSVMVLCAQH